MRPMVRKKLWLFVCLMMILAGCGGGSKSLSPHTAGGPAAQAKSGASGFDSSATSTTSPAPASEAADAPRGGSASAEPAPSTRPGLGTEYGETRSSRVHDVTFVRDAGRP